MQSPCCMSRIIHHHFSVSFPLGIPHVPLFRAVPSWQAHRLPPGLPCGLPLAMYSTRVSQALPVVRAAIPVAKRALSIGQVGKTTPSRERCNRALKINSGFAVEDKHRQFQMPVSRLKDPMPSEHSLVTFARKVSAKRAYPIIHPYQDATQTPTFSSQASSRCPGPAKSPVRLPGRRVKPLFRITSHTSRASVAINHLGRTTRLVKGPCATRPLSIQRSTSLTDRDRFA